MSIYEQAMIALVKGVVARNPDRKIEQIKELRSLTGFGLKLSKDLVEAGHPAPPPRDPILAVLDEHDRPVLHDGGRVPFVSAEAKRAVYNHIHYVGDDDLPF